MIGIKSARISVDLRGRDRTDKIFLVRSLPNHPTMQAGEQPENDVELLFGDAYPIILRSVEDCINSSYFA